MWVKTKDGWVRPTIVNVIPAEPEPKPLGHSMNCYALHGYASYENWLNEKR